MLTLLNSPVDSFQNIITILALENYPKLITYLSFENRKKVAIDVARTCIEFPVPIPSADEANNLLELLQPLINDDPEQPQQADDEDFELEHNLVASLVHLFESDNAEQLFLVRI